MKKDKQKNILSALQIFFYLGFLFLWFKGNFAPLSSFTLSPLVMLIPLLAVIVWRLVLTMKGKKIHLPRLSKENLLAIGIIISVAFFLRLPYLLNHYGLLNSDAAMFCLEGKHISEGQVPPICSYGQLYLGTLPSHFFALVFKIFGYSVFAFKFSTFLLYISFVIFHFLFLRSLFPFTFSLFVALFYFLPLGYLVPVSLDGDFIFPLIFLLGLVIIYLGFFIAEKKQEKYLSWLGFLIGLAFWANALSVYFSAVALFLIFLAYKFRLMIYFKIFAYFLVGFFPQLLLEIYYGFFLTKFLSGGELIFNWEKIKKTVGLIAELLFFSRHPGRIFLVFFMFLGFLTLFFYGLKTKKLLIIKIYNFYFLIFFLLYFLSAHSNVYFVRYLYPLLFCVPILFLATFLLIKGKIKYMAITAFLVFILIGFELSPQYSYLVAVKNYHLTLKKIVSFLTDSGIRYWKGDFWTAYLMTAITGEKALVASTSLRRYYPYELEYYNNYNERENFIFLRGEETEERRQARRLLTFLETTGVSYEKKEIDDCWLIYNIESPIINVTVPPPYIPQISEPQIQVADGFLRLTFKNITPSEKDISFWINVEIPQFSQVTARFSLLDEKISVEIPFPPEPSFKVIFYLDYGGIKIPPSYREISLNLPEAELSARSRPPLVYLYGFGSVVTYENKQFIVCQKETKIEWNRALVPEENLTISLSSPFKFSQLYWYGHFFQEVDLWVNNQFVFRRQLKEGQNLLRIGFNEAPWKEKNNIITLRFKYHFRFGFTPRWNTAALLDKIEVVRVF